MFVQDDDLRVIKVVINFANLEIKSPQDVQRIFCPMPVDRASEIDWIGNVGAAAFQDDQRKVRDWLKLIEPWDKKPRQIENNRKEVAVQIAEFLKRTVQAEIRFDPISRDISPLYTVTGVEAAFSWGLALLLSRENNLADRIGQCPHCTNFNFASAGKPRRYCNADHRETFDAELAIIRARKWRAKKKRERSKKISSKK